MSEPAETNRLTEVQTSAVVAPVLAPVPSDEQTAELDLTAARELAAASMAVKREIARRVVGQADAVEQLLIALFSGGHCLFVGVPGLGKTLLISTLSEILDLRFQRIQFTPDLMPSDITGTEVLEEDRSSPVPGRRVFRFIKGPLFANIILADEINRTPPKTQAALLQAMQEHRVTAGGQTHVLEPPFCVFATQNPIEQEGTYPLPEAQLDRFMFQVDVGYPSSDEEVAIVRQGTSAGRPSLTKVLSPADIIRLQELVLRVPVADHVVRYAVALVRATRPGEKGAAAANGAALDFVRDYVSFGCGPRASQYLILGAKARAILNGRAAASIEDVRALARPTLQHRLIVNFHAEAEAVTSVQLVDRLLDVIRQ